MNLKIVSTIAMLAVSAAFAQDYEAPSEEASTPVAEPAPEEEASEPAPAPAVEETKEEAPAAAITESTPEESAATAGSLNVLHGSAYNRVGNEAGASTVRGDMSVPYKMFGRTLAYVEPTDQYGAIALSKGSFTYLLAFDNAAGDVGMLTAGLATKGFGIALDLALAKHWISSEEKDKSGTSKTDASFTESGDIVGLKFAAPLGALDIAANAYWQTFNADVDSESDGTKFNSSKWNLGGAVTLSNSPSAKTIFWSLGADFLRHEDSQEVKAGGRTVETTNPGSYLMAMPRFNLAFPLAQKEDARIFAGLNTRLPLVFYDKIENSPTKEEDSYMIIGLYTTPNLLAEMSVSENWIIFGGASFDWEVFSYASEEYKEDGDSDKGSIISMKTGSALANAGARFQYKSLTLEAAIADNLYNNNWAGLIGSFSAMFTF